MASEYRILLTSDDIDSARRLLRNVYVDELKFIPPPNNPINQRIEGDMLVDDYDNQYTWFGCFDNGSLVAFTRTCTKKQKEVELFLGNNDAVRHKLPPFYIEVNRTTVHRNYRNNNLYKLLIIFALNHCIKQSNIPMLTTTTVKTMMNSLTKAGECIGAMKYYKSDRNYVNVYLVDCNKCIDVLINEIYTHSKL